MRKRGYPLVGSSNLPLRNSFLFFIHLRFLKKFNKVVLFFQVTSSYGHTTVKAPHPIRTAKLSTVGLVQYFGRGLQGNHQCCMASFLFFYFFRFVGFEPGRQPVTIFLKRIDKKEGEPEKCQ